MHKIFAISLLMAVVIFSRDASAQQLPIIVNGSCGPASSVSINGDTTGRFACDSAIITRTPRGVLIQFTDKKGDDGRILGFAGVIEGKQGFGADRIQVVEVQRIYLAGGAQPITAMAGTCFLNWTGLVRTGGRSTGVICGGKGSVEGSIMIAKVVLSVKR